MNRRTFLVGTAASTLAMATSRRTRAADANSKVVLALMGANNRGSQLAQLFARQAGAEIAYVCDCDENAIPKGIKAASSQGAPAPKGIKDFRTALDDPAVDALICAAPNHWHAAATILACAAGKHVYVEKPASHSADEGEKMIAAARDAGRVVQVGMQRRSGELYQQMVERVRGGELGRILFAKSWYHRERPSVGRGKEVAPPPTLDYALWQGPIPERPYRDNIIHYNWHHFWQWGDGEIGNNGVHTMDICRWAMNVDFPRRVTVAGAKLRYDDDQETPDTMTATFDFDGAQMVWEGISWSQPVPTGGAFGSAGIGVELRGENGTLHIDDHGCAIYDRSRKLVNQFQGPRGDDEHIANFLNAIRESKPRPNADIEEGHKSALLSHLGNIAYRSGQTLEVDPATGHLRANPEAQALWSLQYRPGWMESA